MAILTRLGRLFQADVNAALDRLEEPDLVLRQALREMEEQLNEAALKLKAAELEQRDLQDRRNHIESALRQLAGELDLCFSAGNEDLQRLLLRRRIEHERRLVHYAQRKDQLQRSCSERRQQIDEQRRRLEQLRERARMVERSGQPLEVCEASTVVSDADVELALLRERAARGGA